METVKKNARVRFFLTAWVNGSNINIINATAPNMIRMSYKYRLSMQIVNGQIRQQME